MFSKRFVTIFVLILVQGCLSKPAAESGLTEGRGIGSTLWDWLTYPFTWWSSQPELPPINEQLIASTSKYVPQESIEIAKHNVTVWCNDQTCTTQKCDRFGCKNISCNIYDTDLRGECREYNIISTPDENVSNPTEPFPKPQDKPEANAPETTTVASVSHKDIQPVANVSTTQKDVPVVEEHPLELEAVLSSTLVGNEEGSNDKGGIPPE